MNKILIFLLINLNFSSFSFGQINEQKIDMNNIVRMACSEFPLNPTFILKVKTYEIRLKNGEGNNYKDINPKWVKSIDVIKNSKILNRYNLEEDKTLVIIEFKDRKWKKLPKDLKEELVL